MAYKTDLGTVQVRNDVISTIAALAAQEVQGVAGIWRPFPPLPWFAESGVKADVRDQEVRLSLNLVAHYGVDLPAVAAQVQEKVREMIDQMTHLSATEVHVSIHHVKSKRN